jgi:hypothetical protein
LDSVLPAQASTNLSHQQKLKVREVHNELMIRMEGVLREREGILQHLQASAAFVL